MITEVKIYKKEETCKEHEQREKSERDGKEEKKEESRRK